MVAVFFTILLELCRALLRERARDGLRHSDQMLNDLALLHVQIRLRPAQLQLKLLVLLPERLLERQVRVRARKSFLQH